MDSFFRHAGELAPEITDCHFVELFQILCSIVKSIVSSTRCPFSTKARYRCPTIAVET